MRGPANKGTGECAHRIEDGGRNLRPCPLPERLWPDTADVTSRRSVRAGSGFAIREPQLGDIVTNVIVSDARSPVIERSVLQSWTHSAPCQSSPMEAALYGGRSSLEWQACTRDAMQACRNKPSWALGTALSVLACTLGVAGSGAPRQSSRPAGSVSCRAAHRRCAAHLL